MLMHGAEGASLRMTARQATEAGVADVCDVAVLKRLRQCGEWFGWMTQKLVSELISPLTSPPMQAFPGRCLQLVDGSVVCEPGGKGAKWRVHFALDLLRGRCRQVEVTTNREAESLTRFSWNAGDIVIADRNFAKARDIGHVRQCGADVIVRAKLHEPVLRDADNHVWKDKLLIYKIFQNWQCVSLRFFFAEIRNRRKAARRIPACVARLSARNVRPSLPIIAMSNR